MGYTSHSADSVFDAAVASAESTRQGALVGTPTQAAVNAAEIAFYRAVKANQIAKGYGTTAATIALLQLGTGGS